VNFYSHAAIATLFTDNARMAFGAMLPDLASLVGSKPPQSSDPLVMHGCALHHATDRAFHDSAGFQSACGIESRALRSQGMPKGPALAAAHVGIELALDAALGNDEPTRLLFRRAINLATPAWVEQQLSWTSTRLSAEFETLRLRLQKFSESKPGPDGVTLGDRICRTLSNRPRLSVRADDRALLQTWADGLARRCDYLWGGLLESVLSGLGEADWRVPADLKRTLRFRRACSTQL
jgi:hypothetical protein